MSYRLRLVSKTKVSKEVFHEDLGYLHNFAEENGYYGQIVIIHETVEALDGPEVLGLVDRYVLDTGRTNPLTGARSALRGPLRPSA
jgi:hypothetical protein